MSMPFLYLASQSPRRSQLLTQLGVHHELLLPGADEDSEALEQVLPGEAPARYVQRVTGLKWQAAQARRRARGLPAAPILCADTTVALGRQILGKPLHAADATRMLGQLAGHSHTVLTAVAVGQGAAPLRSLSRSRVRLLLSPAQIATYVASGEPMGKAGAYAVQGRAAAHIAYLSGSYSGIMGLPLFETAALLRQLGWSL